MELNQNHWSSLTIETELLDVSESTYDSHIIAKAVFLEGELSFMLKEGVKGSISMDGVKDFLSGEVTAPQVSGGPPLQRFLDSARYEHTQNEQDAHVSRRYSQNIGFEINDDANRVTPQQLGYGLWTPT